MVQLKIQKEKIFFVAIVKKSIVKMDFFTGKLRDQGLKFSHEPRYARLLAAYPTKGIFSFLIL